MGYDLTSRELMPGSTYSLTRLKYKDESNIVGSYLYIFIVIFSSVIISIL